MTDSILDYSKNKNMESIGVNILVEQLSDLISVREDMAKNLEQLDEIIGEIILELRKLDIDSDTPQ